MKKVKVKLVSNLKIKRLKKLMQKVKNLKHLKKKQFLKNLQKSNFLRNIKMMKAAKILIMKIQMTKINIHMILQNTLKLRYKNIKVKFKWTSGSTEKINLHKKALT